MSLYENRTNIKILDNYSKQSICGSFHRSLINLLITSVLFGKKHLTIHMIIDKINNTMSHYLIDKYNVSNNYINMHKKCKYDNNYSIIFFDFLNVIPGFDNDTMITWYINNDKVIFTIKCHSHYNFAELFIGLNSNDNIIIPNMKIQGMDLINNIYNEYKNKTNIVNGNEINIINGYHISNDYKNLHDVQFYIDKVNLCYPNLCDSSMNNLLNINYNIFIDSIIQYLIILNRIQKKFKLSNSITLLLLNNNLDFIFCNGIVFNSVILLIEEKNKLKYMINYVQDYQRILLTKNKKRMKYYTTIKKELRSMYQNI